MFLTLLSCAPGCDVLEPGTAQPPSASSLVVSFIDVGQGDAVLVQAGVKSYLVDTGRFEEGPNVMDLF